MLVIALGVLFTINYRYEKMISGKYLGEIARQALQSLVREKVLFGGKSSKRFDTFEGFGTKYVSMVEAG